MKNKLTTTRLKTINNADNRTKNIAIMSILHFL